MRLLPKYVPVELMFLVTVELIVKLQSSAVVIILDFFPIILVLLAMQLPLPTSAKFIKL